MGQSDIDWGCVMTRAQLLALSVVCCGFGLLALYGSGTARGAGAAINLVLAAVLAVFTGRDLLARGVRFGWLIGLSYLAAPLVGLVLYGIFSGRPASAPASSPVAGT